ncbi:MAG: 7TM-DISM domain-containing protein, partial [Roseateles sp.]
MSRPAGRLAQALLARLFLMLLCLLGSAALQAQPLLTLSAATDQAPSLDLRSALSLWVEPGPGGPAPDQAPPELREGRGFKPASLADLNPGYTRDTYWLRLRLHNPQPRHEQRVLLLEPARLESVTLYWHGEETAGWQRSRAGTDQPFHLRELPLRDQAFVLNLAPGEERVLEFTAIPALDVTSPRGSFRDLLFESDTEVSAVLAVAAPVEVLGAGG